MWSDLGLFAKPPQSVFDVYTKTAQGLADVRKQRLANALSQIKLNYAPQMAQQAADLGKANVAIKQSDAQYEPSMNAADLMIKHLTAQGDQLTNAMNSVKFKYLPQQQQAEIAFKNAQIEKIKSDIKYAPMKLAQQQSHFGNAYKLNRMLNGMDKASKAAWIASHADQYSQMMNDLVAGPAIPGMQPAPTAPNPQNTPTPNQAPANSVNMNPMGDMSDLNQTPPQDSGQGNPQMPPPDIAAPQNNAPPIAQAPSPDSAPPSFQFTSQIAANKNSVSAPIYKRFENGLEFEKFLNDKHYDRIAANAALYAGALGKGKAALDAIMRSNPQSYEDYLEFHNSFASTAANYNKVMEGLGVQESQRSEILGNITKAFDSNTGNPERAIDQYNRWKNTMRNVVKSASQIAQPAYPGLLEKHYGINLNESSNVSLPKAMAINNQKTRPGYVYVDNGKGDKGYITEEEWNNASEKEKSSYKRIE